MNKIYVDVMAEFSREGSLMPREIIWEDGRRFEVDRVVDVRRAASLKAGGVGMRYLCMICGCPRYLYYEDNNMWFVENTTS